MPVAHFFCEVPLHFSRISALKRILVCARIVLLHCASGLTGGERNGFKLKEGRFILDIRKEFFYSEGSEALALLPEKPWVPHPWSCSRLGWMGLWAAWAVGGNQPTSGVLELDDLYGPFQYQAFYDSTEKTEETLLLQNLYSMKILRLGTNKSVPCHFIYIFS